MDEVAAGGGCRFVSRAERGHQVGWLAEQPLADVAASGGDLAQVVEELQHGQVRLGRLAGDWADLT